MVTKEQLIEYNRAYRSGNPLISDEKYDLLKAEYEQRNGKLDLLDSGFGDKTYLRNVAGSLIKVTKLQELLSRIGTATVVYLAPKLDGISVTKQDGIASTRGDDGITGNDISHHFAHVSDANWSNGRGEVLFDWDSFNNHIYPEGYKHPRNAISGLFNPETRNSNKTLINKASFVQFFDEDDGMRLNADLWKQVPTSDISEEYLQKTFDDYYSKWPCDGIVVATSEKVDMADNSIYPKNIFAYKSKSFDKHTTSIVVRVERQISKYGTANPVLVIKPVELDGATISKIYVDNEAFVKSVGIGVGTSIGLVRSGGIIPRLTKANGIDLTFERKLLTDKMSNCEKSDMTSVYNWLVDSFGDGTSEYLYEEPDSPYEWNGLDIRIMETDKMLVRKIEHFLTTLGCKEVGSKTIEHICKYRGVKSLEQFLQFDLDLLADGIQTYGVKEISKMKKGLAPLSKVQEHTLMAATSIFEKLGSEKLKIYLLDGAGAKGLGDYANSEIQRKLPEWTFFKDFWCNTLKKEIIPVTKGSEVYCHTMCRIPKDIIMKMASEGKEVVDGYSKKVTHLVVPSLDITSSKMKKAKEDGIEIVLLSELVNKQTGKTEEASLF